MSVDRDLVERIAREVVARLGESSSSGPSNPSSSCSCREPSSISVGSGGLLVVLGGGTVGIEEMITQISSARSRFTGLTLYLTPCAEESNLGVEMRTRLRPDSVFRASRHPSVDDILSGAAAVAYPIPSMSTAAKVSMLITDSTTSSIAVNALMRRIPVVMATNSLMASLTSGGYTPPGFQEVGAENIRRLEKIGVATCDIRHLGSALSGGSIASHGTHGIGSLAPRKSESGYSASHAVAASACVPTNLVGDIKSFLNSALADDPSCAPCAAKVSEAIEKCIAAGACRIGTVGIADPEAHTSSGVAQMIDHTLLKPNVMPSEIEELCAEARKHRFKSVCINPGYVALCKRLLQGSGVLVCTVVGFPLGATTTSAKAGETRDAIADGADEIDMVINIGALKAGDYEKVRHDIEAVVEAAKGRTVKVILETSLLTDEEKVAGCQLSVAAGAHFVKTSTGFGGGGATAEDIALMRKVVGPGVGVKASGGVRTKEDVDKMIAAGANRIGASASVSIVTGKKDGGKGY